MTCNIKPILIGFFILIISNATAQNMKVVSVSVEQKITPVLKGKDTNQLLQLKIETVGNKKPVALREAKVELSGSDIQNDIEQVEIFYSEEKSELSEGIRFGIPEKPAEKIVYPGHQKLNEGTNIFWISVKLTDKANLTGNVLAAVSKLKIGSKKYQPDLLSELKEKRFGIALRKHNDDNVDTYRIPGLETTNNGTLIAVYDVRRNNSGDLQDDIDVGMSRSTDGGLTWEPMKIIMDMGNFGGLEENENGIGDPSILVDRKTNTIWVAGLWAHGKFEDRFWNASKPGISPELTGQIMLVKSEDDGINWSQPINITDQIKNPEWQLFFQGPGKGITMTNGTLVFPAQFKDKNRVPYSTIIYSEDGGATWEVGTGAKPETTEAQVIELNDGKLMLNMRDNRNVRDKSDSNGRAVMVTDDMGKTWTEHPTSNHSLIEPTCMASIVKEKFMIDGKLQNVVLFSNPASKDNRDSMTVKISFDDGKTWPSEYNFLLDELIGNGYSCLTKIDDNAIGILYEGSQANLVFQQIPIGEMIMQHTGLNYIFKSGTDGYNTFRIPAIVTAKSGKILAFAEGRVNGRSDTGNINLVMKSSEDGGHAWSPLQVIWDDGENVCGNPAPVVDLKTGTVHLLMTWNLGDDHERQIIDGESKDTRRVFVCSSVDEGLTWTRPKEITSTTKQDNWTWYATGPCHGIQLKYGDNAGRLVVPCDHIEAGTKKYYSHVIYSDNHGETWKLGGTTPQDQVNECTVAELPDGRLMLNMRNYDRTQKSRKVSYSSDGGITWSDIRADSTLIEPICEASLLYSDVTDKLYFLNPASTDSRTNMTLKASSDYGKTWKTETVLNTGPSAYSDLTLIDSNTLGCLYEGGKFNPYEGIIFKTISIKK